MDYRFAALEALQHLREALKKYPPPGLLQEINALTTLVQNQRFIVAVAGEFKRGKSSLINALLGMPILPMDILPTTATANHIVYGPVPSVQILKKDGSKLQITVDELKDYVTKLTAESFQNAKSIQETVIEYPTILCQNGVEIVDTPGLNDNEEMENITNSILQNVHAVVFAVSATTPLSETEAAWLAGIIKNDRLQYLMFAVTFFDRVKKQDRQKVLDTIRKRISTMVQERVQAIYPDQPDLQKKAERMTDPQNMFLIPVSSSDALDAFVSGDDELLQKSNLPEFKQSLMMAVNAHQNEYAASCGFTKSTELADSVKDIISNSFALVSTFSVRDENTANFVREIAKTEPQYHLDPVAVGNFDDEIGKASECLNRLPPKYCIVYSYHGRMGDSEKKAVLDVCRKEKMTPVSIGGSQKWVHTHLELDPFEVLYAFKNAAYAWPR